MSILSLENLKSAKRQRLAYIKTAATAQGSNRWNGQLQFGGDPGGGTLAGASTAAGVVQTDAVGGYPVIEAFNSGAVGYISKVECYAGTQMRFTISDCLWKSGAHAFNANDAVTFPGLPARFPADYYGLELWAEQVTAPTGVQNVTVTYTDDAGNTGQSTGAIAAPVTATPIGCRWQLPLLTGDNGIRAVSNVLGSVATVSGTFNILILRPLFQARYKLNGEWQVYDLLSTGMPRVYEDSALDIALCCDSASSAVKEFLLEIASL